MAAVEAAVSAEVSTPLNMLSDDEYLVKFSVLTLLDELKGKLLKSKPRDPRAFLGAYLAPEKEVTHEIPASAPKRHRPEPVKAPGANDPVVESAVTSATSCDASDSVHMNVDEDQEVAALSENGDDVSPPGVQFHSGISDGARNSVIRTCTPTRIEHNQLYGRDVFYQLFSTVSENLRAQVLSRRPDQDAMSAFREEIEYLNVRGCHRLMGEMFRMLRCFQKLLSITASIPLFIQRNKAVDSIVEASSEMLGADRVVLWLVDPEDNQLVFFDNAVTDREVLIPLGRGIIGHAVSSGQVLVVPDVNYDPRYDPEVDTNPVMNLPTSRSMLYAPVIDFNNQCVAVLQVVNRKGRQFGSDDIALVEAASFVAGYTLENAKLYKRIQRAERKSAALLQMFKQTERKKGHTLSNLVDRIIDTSYSIFNADRVTLFMIDSVKQELWFARAKNIDKDMRIPMGSGIAGFCARERQMINAHDVYNTCELFDPSVDTLTGYHTHSVLCKPVLDMHDEPIAVIQLINKKDDFCGSVTHFTKDDEQLLDVFCTEVSKILQMYPSEVVINQVVDVGELSYIEMFSSDKKSDVQHEAPQPSANAVPVEHNPDVDWTPNATLAAPDVKAEHVWDDVSFDALQYSSDDLIDMAGKILHSTGLLEEFNIDPQVLHNFLVSVRDQYNSNPFHNWYHAFSVFQFSYYMARFTSVMEYVSREHHLALLIAALCHDLDHEGLTNDFLVRTENVLALTYNNVSVLENHHACCAMTLLRKPGHNIFANLSADQLKLVKTVMVQAILGTDMEQHFIYVEFLNDVLQKGREIKTDKDRQVIVNLVLHAADLSNQCFSPELSRKWGGLVFDEFESQAGKEQDRGLVVPPFRLGLEKKEQRIQMQLGFIDYVLAGFWKSLASFMPGLEPAYDNLMKNREMYGKLKERFAAEKEGKEGEEEEKKE